ncbi:MAG: exodeoxyribonuclease VII large subunit [Gammaproteobacteria bacterium]|nr:exodeoxyribonuclease VII large subunit [Gammaproteobacteria bacterium]MDH3505549.1 exodeoxyribonuclease VII large subunit [Gammaproteobacteria bacterium]
MDLFDDQRAPGADQHVFSVAELNREARLAVESSLGIVWVEGEISNLARPASGHMYWSLKDEHAQLRCAMFRQRNRSLGFEPQNGQQILARGRVSIYEARGEFQLVIDHAEPAGEGLLRRRFEALKQKLAAEGLFDEDRKQALPVLPARIGVVTSPSGAAIRDVLTVLARRFPATAVLIYPTAVQGDPAAEEIARTLELANRRRDCDLLILTRGGGSLEDLWAFNEEIVARALAAIEIPVIAGVGHEIDFTIADFVADRRAPTPSGAAELAVPDGAEWLARVESIEQRLRGSTERSLAQRATFAQTLRHRLHRAHPGVQLQQAGQRLDDLEARLRRELVATLKNRDAELARIDAALRSVAPRVQLTRLAERCQWASRSLGQAIVAALAVQRRRLEAAGRALDSISPLATLERGYAIATRASDGRILTDAQDIVVGDKVRVRLRRGGFTGTVGATEQSQDEAGET